MGYPEEVISQRRLHSAQSTNPVQPDASRYAPWKPSGRFFVKEGCLGTLARRTVGSVIWVAVTRTFRLPEYAAMVKNRVHIGRPDNNNFVPFQQPKTTPWKHAV